MSLLGCSGRVERAATGWIDRSQEDPALSGDGSLLAVISQIQGCLLYTSDAADED